MSDPGRRNPDLPTSDARKKKAEQQRQAILSLGKGPLKPTPAKPLLEKRNRELRASNQGPTIRSNDKLPTPTGKRQLQQIESDVLGKTIDPIARQAYHYNPLIRAALDAPDIRARFITGEPYSNLGLGLEAAGLIPFGPFKALKAGKALRAVETGVGLYSIPERAAMNDVTNSALETVRKIRSPRAVGESSLQTQQRKLNSASRAKQAAEYERLRATGASHEEAMGGLAGEFERIPLPADVRPDWSPTDLSMLKHVVDNSPKLDTFGRIGVNNTLNKLASGALPQPHELKELQRVLASPIERMNKTFTSWLTKENVAQGINLPRAFRATLDISGTFRQGLQAGLRFPDILLKNIGPELKALVNPAYYDKRMSEIERHRLREEMKEGGVRITSLGKQRDVREEAYQSPLAEKLTGGKYSPVRASGRAYTLFLDLMRVDMFEKLYDRAAKAGVDVTDRHFRRSLGELVNNATGQGGRSFGSHAASLNLAFWSPRLMASRLNLFNPMYYHNLHPSLRWEARRQAGHVGAFIGLMAGTAYLAGARVETDPRSSDFLKIRVGNHRIDPMGGFQQPVVFGSRLKTNQVKNSSTGVISKMGTGFGQSSRLDLIQRYFRGKLNPTWGTVADFADGQDTVGNPWDTKQELLYNNIPLSVQDAWDAGHNVGDPKSLALGVGGFLLSGSGVGVQTYGARDTSKTSKKNFIKESQDVGLPHPPEHILEQLKLKHDLDTAAGQDDEKTKFEQARKVYVEATGSHDLDHMSVDSDARARAGYELIRNRLRPKYAAYLAWDRMVQAREDAQLARK